MEGYKKKPRERKEVASKEPWDIYVSQGCRMKNVIPHCLKMLEENKKIILTGVGAQIKKTISTTEILKKNHKNLEQLTDIFYTQMEDEWESIEADLGLDSLKVTRNVPTIKITLICQGSGKEK